MRVAVLGAGAGGLSAVVELTLAGHDVRLWNRNPMTLAPHTARKAVGYSGVLGTGVAAPEVMTTDLAEALRGAEAAVVCLPSIAHRALFTDLARLGVRLPVVLNPGHTGGALHARAVFADHGTRLPPLAEFSTLTYVARVRSGTVVTTGRAGTVRAACLPGGEEALDHGLRLFRAASPVPDVLASSLSNVNLVLHPPGAVLGASWVEATGGAFTFYSPLSEGSLRWLPAMGLARMRETSSSWGFSGNAKRSGCRWQSGWNCHCCRLCFDWKSYLLPS
ncbi:NAD/NADP octopine/nopaline dehydrogenase family protein [Actinomadura sp. NPDC048032]|uniref:NAD/NADP octopine/nopaline dehydrogenase family protein n=1 Tax=Actinomadura sp. NPDC048032 TaxID=3155747 RepID=UPI0033ECDB80